MFHTRDYKHRATTEEFTVSRCRSCGAGFLSTRPSKEDIPRYYDERFYWEFENDPDALHNAEKLLEARREQLTAKSAWLAELKPGRLLDIGTMKGEFLHHMQQLGWKCEGVEFSATPPNLFDMPIRYGDFLSMDGYDDGAYDCITMWAVLEHVYEPAQYVEKVSRLLKPGGRFIFVVTNFNSIQGRVFEMDDYPRHLNLFTKRSARWLLNQNGLYVIRTSTDQSIFGGHLQGGLVYFVKRIGGYSREAALSEWKHATTLVPFFHHWRGQSSPFMRGVAFADRLLLTFPELLLDRLGFGFNLTIHAQKKS